MKNKNGTTESLTEYHENGKLAYQFRTISDGVSSEYTYDKNGNEKTYRNSDGETRGFENTEYGMNTLLRTSIGCESNLLGVKQNSLDYFLMKLVDLEIGKSFYDNQLNDLQEAFRKAKAMHKEEIAEAYKKGVDSFGSTFNIKTP